MKTSTESLNGQNGYGPWYGYGEYITDQTICYFDVK